MSLPIRLRRAGGAALRFVQAYAAVAGRRLFGVGLLLVVGALLEGLGLALLVPILSILMKSSAPALPQLAGLLALLVAVSVMRAWIFYARDVRLNALEVDFAEAQRRRVLDVLARAPWRRIVGLDHARVASLMSSDTQRLQTGAQQMLSGISALALLMVQCVVAFTLAPALACSVLLVLMVGVAVLSFSQVRLIDEGIRVSRANRALMAGTTGFLGGLKAAAAQESRASFVAEFSLVQDELRRTQTGYAVRQLRRRSAFTITATVAGAGVILVGTGLFGVAPAVVIATLLILGRMIGPAMQAFSASQLFLFTLPSFEAVAALESELDEGEATGEAPVPPPPGPIELRGVAYRHPGGGGVEEATFAIPPGGFVGLIGPSGHGKTTLVDIVAGLLEPQAGTMLVGGAALDAAGRRGWRQQIGYVTQESFLSNDTVRRNLNWGNAPPDPEDLAQAIAVAGAESLIEGLGGLDAGVGERGALLSGGERQRIAIARALLRKPRLLLLDEATNALDVDSESALLARLADLPGRPAILLVSHRANSVARCDQVLRMEGGRIVPA